MNRQDEAPRAIDQPMPGYFLIRLVKLGPWVPARITHEGGIWRAWFDTEEQTPGAADWTHAAGIERIWTTGRRCTADEYHHRIAYAAWARVHAPDDPAANPTRTIRLADLPPRF